MSIVLFRVDDRLVHGQVTAGWGRVLSPERIVIISDTIAGSDWEIDLYRAAVPEGVEFEVLRVDEISSRYADYRDSAEKVMVIVEDLDTVLDVVETGIDIEKVNLGGIHYDDGREEILSYIFLGPTEREKLSLLRERGLKVHAQDVPSGKVIDIFERLEKNERSR